MSRFFSLAFSGLLSVALVSDFGIAQAPAAKSGSGTKPNPNAVTLNRSVEPSFHIEPIVHRFEGHRGEVIPFEFEIASMGKSMDVVVTPVDLQQEESGIIMHREGNVTTDQLRILSATAFQLSPGESQVIRGEVTIPLAKTNFLSYGILVKDLGQVSEKSDTSTDATQTTAAIRFVTQYVLRVDIETGVQDVSEMRRLIIESGAVNSVHGMPVAQAFLSNPTEFSLECYVRGSIESPTAGKPQPFSLGMPSRRDLLVDERFLVRVLPHSRIRLEAAVDSLMFPGEQRFLVELTNGRRAILENAFPMHVKPGDYPALDAKLAFLGNEVCVEPAQIELGHVSGTSRTANLKFTNSSDKVQTLEIRAKGFDGQSLTGLRLSDSTFEVKPGRTKTVRATIDAFKANETSLFGHLEVVRSSEPNAPHALPLALMFTPPVAPNVDIDELKLVDDAGYSSFEMQVTNQGSGFVPISASLLVDDGKGQASEMADGYGRWLAPGETRVLRFDPRRRLVGGEYQLSLVVQTHPDDKPTRKTVVIQITPSAPETTTAKADSKLDPAS